MWTSPKVVNRPIESCTPSLMDISVETPKSRRAASIGFTNWSTPTSSRQSLGNGSGFRSRSRLNIMQQQQTRQQSAQRSQSSNQFYQSQSKSNPFEASPLTSIDRLKNPTMSPSVFNTVQSPSQEDSSDGFWSLEQRAQLFPADISEESPNKQGTDSMSFLSPNTESKTQEAIDLYFSQHHHTMKSPEDSLSNLGTNDILSSTVAPGHQGVDMRNGTDSQEGSPISSSIHNPQSGSNEASGPVSQYTQTTLTLPPQLPAELEEALKPFFTYNNGQHLQPRNPVVRVVRSECDSSQNSILGNSEQQQNLSTSALRRRLFENNLNASSSDEESINLSEASRDSPRRVFAPMVMVTPVKKNVECDNSPSRFSSPVEILTRGSETPPSDVGSPPLSPIS